MQKKSLRDMMSKEEGSMIENDTWYKCTVCGREGRVGRCCGSESRIPLNKLAKEEQALGMTKTMIQGNRSEWGKVELCIVLTVSEMDDLRCELINQLDTEPGKRKPVCDALINLVEQFDNQVIR